MPPVFHHQRPQGDEGQCRFHEHNLHGAVRCLVWLSPDGKEVDLSADGDQEGQKSAVLCSSFCANAFRDRASPRNIRGLLKKPDDQLPEKRFRHMVHVMELHLDRLLTELQKIPDQKKTVAKDKASQVDKLMAQIRDKVDEAVKQRATNDEEEMSMIRSLQESAISFFKFL